MYTCLKQNLTPSYANIKTPNTSPAQKYTQHKIPTIRIKDEIRYLHSKKQQINLQIYHLHISLANMWNNMWPHIQNMIEEKLCRETKTKYETLEIKLKKQTNNDTTRTTHIQPQSYQQHQHPLHQ